MSLLLEWLGVDGTVWDLRNGPVRGGLGIRGLGTIPLVTRTRQAASLDGQRRVGWSAAADSVHLPIKIGYYGTDPFPDFNALNAAWWTSCRPHKYGQLRVTDLSDASVRLRTLRLESDGREWEYDPTDIGLEDAVLELTADDPWWYGPVAGVGFGVVAAGNYYGGPNGGGLGPPYFISSANSTGSQPVTNPGEVDAWPAWTVQGPVTGVDLAVGSAHIIGSGLNVLAGQMLAIATDPRGGQTVLWLDSTTGLPVPASNSPTGNITRLFSSVGFAPIPAGQTLAVSATLTGSGSASATFTPRYFDGFGY